MSYAESRSPWRANSTPGMVPCSWRGGAHDHRYSSYRSSLPTRSSGTGPPVRPSQLSPTRSSHTNDLLRGSTSCQPIKESPSPVRSRRATPGTCWRSERLRCEADLGQAECECPTIDASAEHARASRTLVWSHTQVPKAKCSFQLL